MGFWDYVTRSRRAVPDTDGTMAKPASGPAGEPVEPDQVLAQVERIAASDGVAESERLVEFLRYVVTQALAGRGDRLTGRVIGQEVFGRGAGFDPQQDSIVRVEAGRLRRRLTVYYAGAGRRDPIRIAIPKGHYAPTFERATALEEPSGANEPGTTGLPRSYRSLIAVAGVGLAAIGLAWFVLSRDPGPGTLADGRAFTASSEAYALFRETSSVSRPPTNRERVEAALDLAREVIRLDPEFAGGYAAEAMMLWRYIMFGHSKAPAEDAARALELAEKAISVQPEFGWGYQALSRAQHLVGNPDGAIVAAQQAVHLQPMDDELQGNLGLILIIAGRPDEAIAPLQEAIRLARDEARAPYWNYMTMAQFHAGFPDESIAAAETNRARGGPMGPHVQLYLAAAYAELGQFADAREAVVRVQRARKTFAVGAWLERLLASSEQRQQLYAALDRAGLSIEGAPGN